MNNQTNNQQNKSSSTYTNRTIIINNYQNIPHRFIITDEPRPHLLEITLEKDKTFITHISADDVYERNGDSRNLYCDKSVSLRHAFDKSSYYGSTGFGTMVSIR